MSNHLPPFPKSPWLQREISVKSLILIWIQSLETFKSYLSCIIIHRLARLFGVSKTSILILITIVLLQEIIDGR